MKRVHVLVEGQTEELFVNEVMQPALPALSLTPVILATKRVKSGGKFKGGIGTFQQVKDDLRRLLNDTSADAVTTLIDLYRLPDDFPGADNATARARDRATHIEAAISREMGSPARLMPYLSVHEFETLLFVSPERATTVFDRAQQLQLRAIAASYGGDVELINDGPTTHPAARIRAIVPGYDKVLGGSIAILETGLDAICSSCPHFRDWFTRLAAL
ncbi:MAG: DUF4276 family protein [Archangium sp.]|nr:DUF4276 family protein [Archangium sp.]MDP3576178.1 DUF4276 family protein [Archangium sp.]